MPDEERKEKSRARDVVKGKDKARAYEKVPRGHYKGNHVPDMWSRERIRPELMKRFLEDIIKVIYINLKGRDEGDIEFAMVLNVI